MLTFTANVLNQPAGAREKSVLRGFTRTTALAFGKDTSDDVLLKAIAGGDRRAMEALYTRHNVRVYRFAVRMTGNPALAEDIVSDVFLDVWRRADGFKARSQVSTWLLAIARNKALSAFRRPPGWSGRGRGGRAQ